MNKQSWLRSKNGITEPEVLWMRWHLNANKNIVKIVAHKNKKKYDKDLEKNWQRQFRELLIVRLYETYFDTAIGKEWLKTWTLGITEGVEVDIRTQYEKFLSEDYNCTYNIDKLNCTINELIDNASKDIENVLLRCAEKIQKNQKTELYSFLFKIAVAKRSLAIYTLSWKDLMSYIIKEDFGAWKMTKLSLYKSQKYKSNDLYLWTFANLCLLKESILLGYVKPHVNIPTKYWYIKNI